MGGFASVDMPELAYLGPRVFLVPLVGAMWYNNKCHTGWTIALTYSYFWWLLTIGFDLRDPLPAILLRHGLAVFEEASFIYFAIFPILMFIAGIIGSIVVRLFDIRYPTPWEAIFPSFTTVSLEGIVSTPCNPIDLVALTDYYCMCARGLVNGCWAFIAPPYWHTFVGVILQLIVITIPDFIFWHFVPTRKWLAFFVPLLLRIVGYILAWLYWSYRTDLYVWGPSEWNTRARRDAARKNDASLYAEDPNIDGFDSVLFAETQALINKNVLIMAVIDILGFIVIGGAIVFRTVPDVDIVIFVGIGYLALLFVAFFFIGLFFYLRHASQPPLCPRRCPITGLILSGKPVALATVTPTPMALNNNTRDNNQQLVVYNNKRPAFRNTDSIVSIHSF